MPKMGFILPVHVIDQPDFLNTIPMMQYLASPSALLDKDIAPFRGDGFGNLKVNVAGGGSASAGGGASTYSNAQGDFTATANAASKTITLSAYASTVLSAQITTLNFLGATVKRYNAAGAADTLPMTNISFSSNILTLSDMTANFVSGDIVDVIVPGPDKAFDATNNQEKVTLNSLIEGENQTLHLLHMYGSGKPTRITTATTTVCQSGAGAIIGVFIESALTGTVTIDDAITATNTISILPIGTPAGYYAFPATVSTGATIVTSASDRLVVFTNP